MSLFLCLSVTCFTLYTNLADYFFKFECFHINLRAEAGGGVVWNGGVEWDGWV